MLGFVLAAAAPAFAGEPQSAPSSAMTRSTLAVVENKRLPDSLRQFTVRRPDGSEQRAFVTKDAVEGEQRKPLMIYVDGSGAQSQFQIVDDHMLSVGLYGLLTRAAGGRFIVAACDKRGVEFGKAAARPGSAEGASEEYLRHATYDDRVSEVRLLIDALAAQPNVDASRIVLVGHSEGADVAAGAAAADPRVTHVAFLAGGGPSQMFDLLVLRRDGMLKSGASAAEAEAAITELEREYRELFNDPTSTTKFFMGHAYSRWASFFSHPPVENLLKSNARLFLAHGTRDESVPIEAFDLLVIELIRAGREDVVIRRCANCDHGLQDVDQPRNGPPMQDLFAEIVAWAGK
jgi:pimeloyl-ACP methyl ester carboxylesterase